jgi:hypothetical protein
MSCCGGWTKYVEAEIEKFYTDKVAPLVRVEIVTLEEKVKKTILEEIGIFEKKMTGIIEQKVHAEIDRLMALPSTGTSKD